MGYPFRVEAKRIWGDKVLLTCMPFGYGYGYGYGAIGARETAAGYGR